jgi:thiol-disulfide isomerase/thioredoxin
MEPASLPPSDASQKAAARGQALIDPGSAVAPAPAVPVQVPGWLGVALTAQSPGRPGVVVSSVLRRSPAAVGGLEVGDVVVGVNDTRVNQPGELSQRVAELGAGERANLMVERAGAPRLLAVQLGENPGFEGQLRLGFVDAGAPEFEQVTVARGALGPTLGALRGRVVVLEFWATWCGACRALLPTLNAWHERYQPHGALVVSVTTDPVEKAARDAAELGLVYPVLSDPDGLTAQAYQAFALPTLFVIDRAGVVRDVSVGYDPQRIAEIEATVARLLSDS